MTLSPVNRPGFTPGSEIPKEKTVSKEKKQTLSRSETEEKIGEAGPAVIESSSVPKSEVLERKQSFIKKEPSPELTKVFTEVFTDEDVSEGLGEKGAIDTESEVRGKDRGAKKREKEDEAEAFPFNLISEEENQDLAAKLYKGEEGNQTEKESEKTTGRRRLIGKRTTPRREPHSVSKLDLSSSQIAPFEGQQEKQSFQRDSMETELVEKPLITPESARVELEGETQVETQQLEGTQVERARGEIQEPKSKKRRMMETAAKVATYVISGGIRAAIEGVAYSHLGFPGLVGTKIVQMGYDYWKGNTLMMEGNFKQLLEATTLAYGTMGIYASVKLGELGHDIFYKQSWLSAAETIMNILPNDTLTVGAVISNETLRTQIIQTILKNPTIQFEIVKHAKIQSPFIVLVEELAKYDKNLQNFVDKLPELAANLKFKK